MRELSMHILDALVNSLEAGATQVELQVVEDLKADRLTIAVSDNGRGMDAEALQRALDPFYTTRTTRHVGLGLPLLAAAARRCDGDLTLQSAPSKGTQLTATFRYSHVDRAPLGNMADTVLAFMLGMNCDMRLRYEHRVDGQAFGLDTSEVEAQLDGVPLSHPQVWAWLQEYLEEGERELRAGEGGTDAENQVNR